MKAKKIAKIKNAESSQSATWFRMLEKPWIKVSSFFVVATAVALNINPILSNLRALPKEIRQISAQYQSWYHADESWNGRWTNNPQIYVDQADMNLSDQDMMMDFDVKNGEIDGTIATKQICDAVPFFDFLLVRGKVSGSKSAEVIVFDFIEGHQREFAKLRLERDGVVMTVTPVEGTVSLFPKEARLGFEPHDSKAANEQLNEFCKNKKEALMDILNLKVR